MSYINLFNFVIFSSIKVSLIVFCIIILKVILKDRLGVRFHYYIWFIMLIRLMMPCAPNSCLSLFNIVNIIRQSLTLVSNHKTHEINFNPLESLIIANGFPMEKIASDKSICGLNTIGMLTWLTGIVIILAYTVIANIRFRKNWRADAIEAKYSDYKILEKCKLTMGIKKNIPIFYTQTVSVPVQYGLFCPCLLLPASSGKILSTDEKTCIMFHELSHIKRKDIAVFWVMTILKAVYWFNPVIWYGFYRMRQDCEMACDALALSYMHENEKQKYGYTIIHMLQNTKSMSVVNTASMAVNKSQIIRRLKMIAHFKKKSYKLSFVSIIILLAIGFMSLTNAEKANVPQQTSSEAQSEKQTEEQAETIKMIWPLPDEYTKIASIYGSRIHPISGKKVFHPGIDIAAPKDTNILAVGKGIVISSEWDDAYGYYIKIEHGNGIVSYYAHCSELLVAKGNLVEAGDIIALVGNTGLSTGPHLHFEVQKDGEPVDPQGFLKALPAATD